MEVVQEESKRKEAEINQLKKQVRSTTVKPVPPPFPPELERYSQRSERVHEEVQQTISSPTHTPILSQDEQAPIKSSSVTLSSKPSPLSTTRQPPPLPYLNEIQDPATKHRLKKVQKCVLKNELSVEWSPNLSGKPA